MILHDVNVLVYAFREEGANYDQHRAALETTLAAPGNFGYSSLVLSGFLRVVTNGRVFAEPTPIALALEFVNTLRSYPNAVEIRPGPRHWEIFTSLCESVGAKGNLVPDAYHAALAIEAGASWITTDGDYSRFPGLRWRHPLS